MSSQSTSAQSKGKTPQGTTSFTLPFAYRLFFLFLEPLATLAGAYYAHFRPEYYLQLSHAASAPGPVVPLGTSVVLSQLANLYLALALTEAIVLRTTADIKVWRALLFVMLVADVGHLYSLLPLDLSVYYDVLSWNAIDWGNVPYLYVAAAIRVAFLLGVGMGTEVPAKRA